MGDIDPDDLREAVERLEAAVSRIDGEFRPDMGEPLTERVASAAAYIEETF